MIIYRIFVLGFILSVSTSFTTQNDIFKNEYVADEAAINALYKKSWKIIEDNPDSAMLYCENQIEMATKIGYKLGLVNAHYTKGNLFIRNSYFDLATIEFYSALSIIKGRTTPDFLKKKSLILQDIGYSYEMTFNYDMAIEYYMEGLEIAISIDYEDCIADLNYNLGVCFRKKNNSEKALEYYNKALEIYQKSGYYDGVVKTFNVIGILHYHEENYDIAKKYYQKAIALSKKHNTSIEKQSWFISNIGETFFMQDQYDSAKYYYSKALALSEKLDDTEKIKWLYNNLGDVYLKEGNYPEAIAYYQKSIALGNGEDRIDEEMKRAYKQLAVAYENTGKYKEALAYTQHFMGQIALLEETKDKLMVQNAQYRMKEVEWQRQLADKENLLAKMSGWLNWGMVVFALFLVVFIYISRRLYLHYTVHKEMKRLLMTPLPSQMENDDLEL